MTPPSRRLDRVGHRAGHADGPLEPESGRWAFVVMNADGSPGVSVDLQAGARADWLDLSLALLLAGGLLAAGAAPLIGYGVSDPARPSGREPALDATPPSTRSPSRRASTSRSAAGCGS